MSKSGAKIQKNFGICKYVAAKMRQKCKLLKKTAASMRQRCKNIGCNPISIDETIGITCRTTDDVKMADTIRTNKQSRICTAGKQPATPRMGYTRIEPEAGGAASLAALCNMTLICRTRGANRPHAEGGQRSGNPPTPRVLYKAKNTKKALP